MTTNATNTHAWKSHVLTVGKFIGSVSVIGVLSFFLITSLLCMFPDILVFTKNISLSTCPLPILQPIKHNILGVSTTPTVDRTSREKIRQYWKDVIASHPDYEDAYVQLIIISYELGDSDDVNTYINQLKTRNPNHALLKTLEGLIEKNKK